MAKFNSPSSGARTRAKNKIVTNVAGGSSYKQSDKLEFVSILLTSFVKAQYYKSAEDQMKRVNELIQAIPDKQFLAKAAIYARNEFGMRSITHVTAAEVARAVKGEQWTRRFYDKVVRRADDITEILSYYLATYGKPVPSSLKKGLAKSFDKFDEYQLAKYRADTKEVSLVDAVNICHPVPTDKNNSALHRLVRGELRSVDTWEAKLTKAGQSDNTEEAKSDAWRSLLAENKLGYFAALRNINNVIEQADDQTFKQLLAVITNHKMIKKSLVMPFRFQTAINNLKGNTTRVNKAKVALSQALELSCDNIPVFDDDTLVVVDYSSSMGDGLNSNRGIGSLFGALLAKSNGADFMIFGSEAAYVSYNATDSALTLADEFMTHNKGGWGYRSSGKSGRIEVGHGTNFQSIFRKANKPYGRIAIFSDMQSWLHGYSRPDAEFNSYKKKYNCNPYVYTFDLSGYGTMQFPENKVCCLAGFSDKVFDIMGALEQDPNALIKKIEAVQL